jgi:lysophospholipase L1-like esterase
MIFRHHPIFGLWHVPNLRAYVPHERGYYVVRTNRDGMRSSRDYAYGDWGGACRILLFGDSFTDGEGVSNDERFSDLLERELPGVEVLNFGLDGSGLDQQVLIYEEMLDRFGGDLVLFCPLVENIRRLTLKFWPVLDRTSGERILVPKPYFTLEGGALTLHQVPVPRTRLELSEVPDDMRHVVDADGQGRPWRALVSRLLAPVKPALARVIGYQPFPQYESPHHPEWRLTAALLARVLEKAGERPVVIAPLPLFYHIEAWSRPTYLERYREFARAHPHVHVLDLLPDFHALSPAQRRRCRYSGDVHYTALGHAVVARGLQAQLCRLGLIQRHPVEEVA